MTIHLITLLDDALGQQERLAEAVTLARAYLRANPPWKDRTILWLCRDCAPPEDRVERSWNPDRGPRGCDKCDRRNVLATELEAVLVDLK
jgi:hypothetical protein